MARVAWQGFIRNMWCGASERRRDFQGVDGCTNGLRKIRSAEPFGVTVWGWGTAVETPSTDRVSYAYPAGANIALSNDVAVPTISETLSGR
jgi:hypothetical protein